MHVNIYSPKVEFEKLPYCFQDKAAIQEVFQEACNESLLGYCPIPLHFITIFQPFDLHRPDLTINYVGVLMKLISPVDLHRPDPTTNYVGVLMKLISPNKRMKLCH